MWFVYVILILQPDLNRRIELNKPAREIRSIHLTRIPRQPVDLASMIRWVSFDRSCMIMDFKNETYCLLREFVMSSS